MAGSSSRSPISTSSSGAPCPPNATLPDERSAPAHQRAVDLRNRRASAEGHRAGNALPEEAQDLVDPALAGGAHRVQVGATDRACAGAEGERLHDVAAATYAAVADDRGPPLHGLGDRLDELDRSGRVVELAAAVVR